MMKKVQVWKKNSMMGVYLWEDVKCLVDCGVAEIINDQAIQFLNIPE